MLKIKIVLLFIITIIFSGCINLSLTDRRDKIKEYTLRKGGYEKIAILNVNGTISDEPSQGIMNKEPSLLYNFVSRLNIISKDPAVKAVIIKINSPGGGTTASDIMYNELFKFKQKTGIKVIVSMMDIAASGGYYIALPADKIFAHPTTITGSIGVIFMRPGLSGLMEKLGVTVDVSKSGRNKDMGSMFRTSKDEENKLFDNLINSLANRFYMLVKKHRRKITTEGMKTIKTARVFTAEEALKLGLIDKIGYLDDVIKEARRIANLKETPRIVVYRKLEYTNDNIYNNIDTKKQQQISIINSKILDTIPMKTGFHYLWSPKN